jgi:hypothetical protein
VEVQVTAGSKLLPAYLIMSHPLVVQATAGSKLLSEYLIVSHPVVVRLLIAVNRFPHCESSCGSTGY